MNNAPRRLERLHTMAYRIQYQAQGGFLSAVVSGKSKYATRIARDIGAQASERAAGQLLIDLRRLEDRVGHLGVLIAAKGGPARGNRRIAVLDVAENDRYYVFAEALARSLGCTLRHFADAASALTWLSRSR